MPPFPKPLPSIWQCSQPLPSVSSLRARFFQACRSSPFLHFLTTHSPSMLRCRWRPEPLSWGCAVQGPCCRVSGLSSGVTAPIALFLFPCAPGLKRRSHVSLQLLHPPVRSGAKSCRSSSVRYLILCVDHFLLPVSRHEFDSHFLSWFSTKILLFCLRSSSCLIHPLQDC